MSTDVEGECNARLFISDDYGDNCRTLRCPHEPGHPGDHVVKITGFNGTATILWTTDERFVCERHGIQPGEYCVPCVDERRASRS